MSEAAFNESYKGKNMVPTKHKQQKRVMSDKQSDMPDDVQLVSFSSQYGIQDDADGYYVSAIDFKYHIDALNAKHKASIDKWRNAVDAMDRKCKDNCAELNTKHEAELSESQKQFDLLAIALDECKAEHEEELKALREALEQAHMAGQFDAGVDPSYSNARVWVNAKVSDDE